MYVNLKKAHNKTSKHLQQTIYTVVHFNVE